METLLSDREKVAFHQPSRIADVKPLVALQAEGKLKVSGERGDVALIEQVGEEAASLLKAAKNQGGRLVHPGVLFCVRSAMEEQADLGAMASLVTDPVDVANALQRDGRITDTELNDGIDYLRRTGSTAKCDVPAGTPLFVDGLALQYLQQAKLLQPLINSEHVITIHQSVVDEGDVPSVVEG